MGRFLLALLLLESSLMAAEWQVVSTGPFVVYSDGGARTAQGIAGELEQFRHALGSVLGAEDIHTAWPIHVVVFSSSQEAANGGFAEPLVFARNSYLSVLSKQQGVTRQWRQEATRLLLETNLAGAPRAVEDGLIVSFGMLAIDGARITLGIPPPAEERNLDWAIVHMLTVSPEYSGKFRILMRNLPRTADNEPAYRNALGKGSAEIVKEAEAYLRTGNFGTVPISGRAMNPYRELYADPLPAAAAQIVLGDARLAKGDLSGARTVYQSLAGNPKYGSEAQEGLGILALKEGRQEEAKAYFTEAIKGSSGAASALLELAKMEADPGKAAELLKGAAARNPRWPEPWRELARIQNDPSSKARFLAEAVKRAPRALADWQAMGQAYLDARLYEDAKLAWMGAERVASTAEQATYCREQRMIVDRAKIDAERQAELAKRKAEADALEKLRQEALEQIRAKEAEVNRNDPQRSADVEVVQLPDMTAARRMPAVLKKVECRNKHFILVVDAIDTSETNRFLFDPSRTLIVGSEQMTFRCNQTLKDVKATVLYQPKADSKLGTTGEVGSIELR